MTTPILDIRDLNTWFDTDDGIIKGCDGVSYHVNRGETLAVVGESGSGKSVAAMSIMNLIPTPPGRIVSGEILFHGRDLVGLSASEMQKIRGNRIAMIFQEPMTSLNPVMPVGRQIGESLRLHQKASKKEALAKAVELLRVVGISAPEKRVHDYPHQMSGGMRQRVMIAIALACRPDLLIADEPTSALDVTVQKQILKLIRDLQRELDMAVIMITHDMGVVAETADKVAVMYTGQVVEYGTVHEIFNAPKHPYLDGLRRSIPRIDMDEETLYTIEGIVPDPLNLPPGCRFAPRCPKAMAVCHKQQPGVTHFSETHHARCWLYVKENAHAE